MTLWNEPVFLNDNAHNSSGADAHKASGPDIKRLFAGSAFFAEGTDLALKRGEHC